MSAKVGLCHLGERIKEGRKEMNLTQKQLSELLNCSRSCINKYETGVTTPPLIVLVKLARIFKMSLDDLILGYNTIDEQTRSYSFEINSLLKNLTQSKQQKMVDFLKATLKYIV